MSDGEFDIDLKWLSAKLEREKKELKHENDRLSKENKMLRTAVSNLYERLSVVSVDWRPAAKPKEPTRDNLSDEGYSGTVGSVVALCLREPSLLKKLNEDIPFLILDILLFGVHALQTKRTLLIFSFQKDATQRPQRLNTKRHQSFDVHAVDHLNQRNSSSSQGLTSIRLRLMDQLRSSGLLPIILLKW
jgi:hypothetical protein